MIQNLICTSSPYPDNILYEKLEAKIQKFDIVYYPEKTIYKGEEILQIRIKDIKIKDDFYEIFTK